MALNAGASSAHIGGALSSVEILAALYGSILNFKVTGIGLDAHANARRTRAFNKIESLSAWRTCAFSTNYQD